MRLELSLCRAARDFNALAALAAASVWSIGAAEAQNVFRTLRVPAMRGELLRFSNGAALINDSYNSSPAALHAMISVLAATPNYQRRILAAGEMRELGATSPELHREAGIFAAKTGKVDWVIGVEGDARANRRRCGGRGRSAGADESSLHRRMKLRNFCEDFVTPGDLLLVKGSRGVKMERIVEALADAVRALPASVPPAEKVRH